MKNQKINSWSPFVKRVQFFESHSKKCSVLWVISEKFQTFGHILSKKKFTSFESVGEKGSSLRVMLKSVRFCGSYQKNSLLCIISQKFNPFFGSNQKKIQSCGSYFQKRSSIIWVTLEKILWVIWRKRCSVLWVIWRKRHSILWVIFKKNSVSHIREEMRCSILCVIFEKRDVQFCASYWKSGSMLWVNFNSLSHILKNPFWDSLFVENYNSLNHIQKKVQFCESYQKMFNSSSHMKRFKKGWILSHICKKIQFLIFFNNDSILWVTFNKKFQFFGSHSKKKVQFFGSQKIFNSLSL